MVTQHSSDRVDYILTAGREPRGPRVPWRRLAASAYVAATACCLLAPLARATAAQAADSRSAQPFMADATDAEPMQGQRSPLSFWQFQNKQAALRAASQSCVAAIGIAEARYGIPKGLLQAIAKVETGRPDPATGRVEPWPWSINADNQGLYFQNLEQSVRHVRKMQAEGVTSIDTGCLQVNLQQHPTAFRTLEDAFDPVQNADYAARFLLQLQRETGDWIRAAGLYHSHTPALSEPYRSKVQHVFTASGNTPQNSIVGSLQSAWASTLKPQPASSNTGWNPAPKRPAYSIAARTRHPTARLSSAEKQPVRVAGW